MADERRSPAIWTAALAVLCLGLLAWSYFGFVVPFKAAAAGRDMPDARIDGYDRAAVLDMLQYLRAHPDPAAILRSMYLGPELIFPVLLTVLLLVLLRLAKPGGTFFGRPIPTAVIAAIFFLPVFYGLADYAENIAGLMLYPPAAPSDGTVALLSDLLPLLVRLKFVTLAITIILLVRFALLRRHSSNDRKSS